jgi:tol-pal system protein YbgF
MTAGRLRRAARFALVAGWGLLVFLSLPGCALKREYVRRGQVMDSLAVRVTRLEQSQGQQAEDLRRLRADLLTELEGITGRLDQLSAQGNDLNDRIDRLGRKLGIGHGDITPVNDSGTVADTARPKPETLRVDADQLYNTAYLDFTRAKYDVAIGGFRSFIEQFPKSDNADNAQYWIGECYYSQGKLDTAVIELKTVLTRYPDGNKASAAAYKLALVYQQQGSKPQARAQLNRVIKDYPNSAEAKLARDRLQALEQ